MERNEHMPQGTPVVRDAGWWMRTAIYWLVLVPASPLAAAFPTSPGWLAGWLVTTLGMGVLIWWRDRFWWLVVAAGLAWSVVVAEPALAVAMVAFASRARLPLTVGFGLVGCGVLALPVERVVSPVKITYGPNDPSQAPPPVADFPVEGVRFVVTVVAFVVLPAMVGLIRQVNRIAVEQRSAFQAEQQRVATRQAALDERDRIAQEMHDVLGHKLSLITMQAGALALNADAGAEVVERESEAIRLSARQALDDLRTILGVLGSSEETRHPQPGLAETRELVAQHQASGARIELRDGLGEEQFPAAVASALYRVVGEGLTNAHRHAPGAAVTLTLTLSESDTLEIEVLNRPSGQVASEPGSGRGLVGLRQRVQALGGQMTAGPTDEGGYRLWAELPTRFGKEDSD